MMSVVMPHCKDKKHIHVMLTKDRIHNMKMTKPHPQRAHCSDAHLWIAVAARGKGRLALTVNAHVSDWAKAEEMLYPVARKKYF